MFGPSTSSNGRSTDTPPRCMIAPQPSASRRIATPSFRSALVKVAPAGQRIRKWRDIGQPQRPAPARQRLASARGRARRMRRSAERAWRACRSLACSSSNRRGGIMRTIEEHRPSPGRRAERPAARWWNNALARIADPDGEGARAFIKVHAEQARAMADAAGHAAPRRARTEPLRRHPDRAEGPVRHRRRTDTGRLARAGRRAAGHSATRPSSQRMLAAGFIPVGRTNMTEFAFSGLGINPHYGTPRSPWDRAARRIPGGSSSGTAVAVADGMAAPGSAPTPAAHAASPQRSAASSATSRRRGVCRSPACCRWRRVWIRSDHWPRALHAVR